MAVLGLRRVSVWLDKASPGEGSFAHGLEWATRLGLPLRGVADGPGTPPAAHLQACAAACGRQGVVWDAGTVAGRLGPDSFWQSDELVTLGEGLADSSRSDLLRRVLGSARTPVLVGAAPWRPLERVLILNMGEPGDAFLNATARLCATFRADPVVLTVAGSEEGAWVLQRSAEPACAAHALAAIFDVAVGDEVVAAVAWVARWRRCTHVFVANRGGSCWWRWLRGDIINQLLGHIDGLTLLALPSGN